MKRKNDIVVIVVFLGTIPWYFTYFLLSCKFNPSVDFLLFTDAEIKMALPENVNIVKTTLKQIKQLASSKIGFTVSLEFPYKLCDYKPAYGLIFHDYLKDYSFWAQSDLDNIFGDLKAFFSEELLNNIDFVSVRHDYCTGCLTLFRNNTLMNNIFKKSKDYKKVLTTTEYLGFDELNHKHCEVSDETKTIEEIETEIETFTHIIRKAEKTNIIRAQFDFILLEGVPGRIKFKKGKLTYQNKYEAALYHLYWLKKIYHPTKIPKKITDTFYISPTKIYTKKR